MNCEKCKIECYKLNDEFVCPTCLFTYKEDLKIDHEMCCGQMTIVVDSFATCLVCGRAIEVLEYEANYTEKSNVVCLYQRYKYLNEKLDLLCGLRIPSSFKFNECMKVIQHEQFDSVYELKNILKQKKMNKFIKYIYHIYKLIKGTPLITLTNQQRYRIKANFMAFEKRFKKQVNRKNCFSYYTVIKLIFDKLKIAGSEYILLPVNHKKIQSLLSSYL